MPLMARMANGSVSNSKTLPLIRGGGSTIGVLGESRDGTEMEKGRVVRQIRNKLSGLFRSEADRSNAKIRTPIGARIPFLRT